MAAAILACLQEPSNSSDGGVWPAHVDDHQNAPQALRAAQPEEQHQACMIHRASRHPALKSLRSGAFMCPWPACLFSLQVLHAFCIPFLNTCTHHHCVRCTLRSHAGKEPTYAHDMEYMAHLSEVRSHCNDLP